MSGMEKTLSEEKEILRKRMKEVLKRLSKEELERRSQNVKAQLEGLKEYKEAKTVMFYWPLPGEVDTRLMIRKAQEENKQIFLPGLNEEGEITPWRFFSEADLRKNTFGFLQPSLRMSPKIDTQQINLVIVPGLAFDKEGYRLGRGKGCYDRFLRGLGRGILKIGLAFSFQILEVLPFNSLQDEKVDLVIAG